MLFTSFPYLLLFLPLVVLTAFYLSKKSALLSLLWITTSSLFFYGFWEISYISLLIVSIFANFSIGQFIYKKPKLLLTIGITFNIGLLGYFKYTNFFIDTLNIVTDSHWQIARISLPLALSFFTFQQIAWLVDQYKKEAPVCSFLEYSCAVSFFPHLIAGPIVQYHDLIPQLQKKSLFKLDWDMVAKGLFFIACGIFKKIMLADTLSQYVVYGFDQAPSLTLLQAWLAMLSYTMQIYFDFSGYCDIAIGSALLLGITLPANFDSPYKAVSVTDFWKRWHMTLGSFFTRYLYIPLGGSRKGLVRTCINILLVMFLSGLWHGAGFGFILWGIAHGVAMVTHRLWRTMGFSMPKRPAIFCTFLFVSFSWVLFRATSLDDAYKVYSGLLGLSGVVLPQWAEHIVPKAWDIVFIKTNGLGLFGFEKDIVKGVLIVLFLCVALVPSSKVQDVWERSMLSKKYVGYTLMVLAAFFVLASFFKMIIIPYTEFIYSNF